jgi:hypothetical protein
MGSRRISTPAAVAMGAVVVTLVTALVVLGSPSAQRQRRLDARRVEDLEHVTYAVDAYWDRHKALPPVLDTVVSDHRLDRVPHDPATNAPYQFTVTEAKAFRLCATFEQSSDEDEPSPFPIDYGGGLPRSWHHGVGLTCFDLAPRERIPK